jgi:hypothetical protein
MNASPVLDEYYPKLLHVFLLSLGFFRNYFFRRTGHVTRLSFITSAIDLAPVSGFRGPNQ